MDSLFGIPMNSIMAVLVVLLAICLAVIGYVALRNRIMFLIGLRNIPRRTAQTVLIIIGLMLSTLIISAAFATGDTVDFSITNQAITNLGHVDEFLEFESQEEEDDAFGAEETIPQSAVDTVEAGLVHPGSDVDGVLPVIFEGVPVINPRSGLSEPLVNLVGVDGARTEPFPDFLSAGGGEQLNVSVLADDEAYINESAAEELDVEAGDTVHVFVRNQPFSFRIVDIVEDRLLTGALGFGENEGLVTRLDTAQAIFGQDGEVDFIAISNSGGVRDGIELTDAVVASAERVIAEEGLDLDIEPFKQDSMEDAEEAGNFMATFFLIFGLFSIAAGILLILMIFVMLAAERKSEMGMTRAVGAKRRQLIQMFMSEGMAYNLVSALVGVTLGVFVSFGITRLMARIFSEFDLSIHAHVTAQSLILSYSLGVVLTFITVTIASWRISNLNIVAAIRDLPETKAANPEGATWKGYLRGVLNAFVAVGYFLVSLIGALRFGDLAPLFLVTGLIGLAGPWLYLLRGHPFSLPADQRTDDQRIPKWPLAVLPLAPFYLVALLLVRLARDRRPRSVPTWLVLAGIVVAPLGLVLVALQDRDRPIAWGAGFGTLGVVVGALLMQSGMASDAAFPFALGFSLIVFGAAVTLRYLGFPPRPVFTTMGIFLLILWALVAGNRLEFLFGELEGDIEMFFLSGIAMVTASTFVLIHNADLVLAVVSRLGGRFGRILPAVKTAVAYPLANKFRTGMTLAMISLVIFALTMMSTLNTNFNRLFLSDEARGGWDVLVEENPNNPIEPDLTQALAGSVDVGQFRAVGRVDVPHRFAFPEVRNAGDADFDDYPVRGVDRAFLEGGDIRLESRAVGFESDREVWAHLRDNPKFAVIDVFAVREGFFGEGDFRIEGIGEGDDTFEPVTIEIRDPVSGRTAEVEVIGVISTGASAAFFGIYVPEETFIEVFGEAEFSRYYVGLNDPGRAGEVAKRIEAAPTIRGAQASSIKEDIDDQQATQRNFFRLMQGFMGLGLFVGIAALGVIAFRSVVERRQQIGMLRAIGYRRGTVALSFLIESSFVTILGIVAGVSLAIWLSFFLISSDEFPTSDAGYVIPWVEILLIAAFAYLASLVMTLVPSRRAAGIPIAQALRYE